MSFGPDLGASSLGAVVSNAHEVLTGFDVEFTDDPYELAKGCGVMVLARQRDVIRALDLARVAQPKRLLVLVDGRNVYKSEDARIAGPTYLSIGRPDVHIEAKHCPDSVVNGPREVRDTA